MSQQRTASKVRILPCASIWPGSATLRPTRLFAGAYRPLSLVLSHNRCRLVHKSPGTSFVQTLELAKNSRRNTHATNCSNISFPQQLEMAPHYRLPVDKLKSVMEDESKTPLVLISCGSFSPVTYLHLRIFEMCQDWVRENSDYEIVGGYFSPVSDAYGKKGLASAEHRNAMCRLAVADSKWLMVDDWEAIKPEYTRTAFVLDHLEHEINTIHGGIKTRSGGSKPARIALLSGADLLLSMSSPGVWSDEDLDHILGRYPTFVIERTGTDLETAIKPLEKWRRNIFSIPQPIPNDISSTKIRAFLGQNKSVRYLVPEPVLEHIEKHALFKNQAA